MARPILAPTAQNIAEDLTYANDIGGNFEYAYDEAGDALIAHQYSDTGEIIATFTAQVVFTQVTS